MPFYAKVAINVSVSPMAADEIGGAEQRRMRNPCRPAGLDRAATGMATEIH